MPPYIHGYCLTRNKHHIEQKHQPFFLINFIKQLLSWGIFTDMAFITEHVQNISRNVESLQYPK